LSQATGGRIVSKQDSVFFNVFSLVLGILVAIALVLFAFARLVGANTQREHVLEDAKYHAAVRENVQPFARVAIAGEDNSALAIVATSDAGGGAAAVDLPTDGPGVYALACTACHGAGIAGAPKSFDRAAWTARLAQGKDTLYKHAIEGFQGSAGVMPAKGGRTDLSDDLVKLAVDHMLEFK
jgi:cytochrome c5